jgi:hypothetical protein
MDAIEKGKFYYVQEFRNQLVDFLDELIEQFPRESQFVIMRIFIKDQVPALDVLGRFIRDVLPFKNQIQKRDHDFLIKNSIFYAKNNTSGQFRDTSVEKIDHFGELWKSNQLDDEDRKVIWDWLDVFVELASKYYARYGAVEGWN